MTPVEIRIELLRRGISVRGLARQLGVSPQAISAVIHRRLKSRQLREAIAHAIGRTPEELWQEVNMSTPKNAMSNSG